MLPALFTKEYCQQLEVAKLRARRSFLGYRQGAHISPRKGHGIEFSDYRQYELGDNPRHIDWNVYGRTDRFVIKRFQEEEALSFSVLLDSSLSMSVDYKWQRARDVALSLGYIALSQGDTVTSTVLGSSVTQKFSGKKQISVLASKIPEQVVPAEVLKEEHFMQEVLRASAATRFPGICFLISDFLCDFSIIEKSLLALRKRNFIIHVVQVLGNTDLKPAAVDETGFYIDAETDEEVSFHWTAEDEKQYQRSLTTELAKLERYCQQTGVYFSRLLPTQTIAEFLFNALIPSGGIW